MNDPVADAINNNFTSPNVSDSNLEPANIVDAIDNGAKALWNISRRGSDQPQVEATLAVASAIERLAVAVESLSQQPTT